MLGMRSGSNMKMNRRSSGLKGPYFFQELPPDVQQLVWEEARFKMGIIDSQGRIKPDYLDDVQRFGLDTVLDETIDDFINRHNQRRAIREWLRFAEKGRD